MPGGRLAILIAAILVLAPFGARAQQGASHPLLAAPIWVYNNWSAYDELSDDVPLTEALAMHELDQVARYRKLGVPFDYYVMDAFWYDPDGGYRTWRHESWPNGPDRWLAAVKSAGVKPGLWFSTNTLTHMHAVPQWRDSMTANDGAMALYTGGFLADLMDVLDTWYGRGFRLFKFDMANFEAVAKADEGKVSPREARTRNLRAFHAALQVFRRRHPDVVLVGFNGFVGDMDSTSAPITPLNFNWLDVFDTFYSGDPRPSNVPEMDFWRSVDVYSDDMVRSFEQAGIPLPRIDSTNFMIGNTATNYHRGAAAWRGSLLLMVSHGGWVNTVHGNLEFLEDADVRWLAKVRAVYDPLQREGLTKSFGGIPGGTSTYGFGSVGADGALYTVVNPSQKIRTIRLPQLSPQRPQLAEGRVLFRDAGFDPVLRDGSIRLGPGQLALVGFGRYASPDYDLGTEKDIRIPREIEPLPAHFKPAAGTDNKKGVQVIEATVAAPPPNGGLRIVLSQRNLHDAPVRSVTAQTMDRYFVISASQDGKPLPVETRYGKVVWSGLAWGVAEIRDSDFAPGKPITLRLSVADRDPELHIEGEVFRVRY